MISLHESLKKVGYSGLRLLFRAFRASGLLGLRVFRHAHSPSQARLEGLRLLRLFRV